MIAIGLNAAGDIRTYERQNSGQHDIRSRFRQNPASRSRSRANVSRNQDGHAKAQAGQLAQDGGVDQAQAEHKKWLKAHGIKVTKNTLRT